MKRALPQPDCIGLSWQFHVVDGTRASLLEILTWIEAELARGATAVELEVLDPDPGAGHYAGEAVEAGIHRPLRVWIDLAERLGLRLCTPRSTDGARIRLRFEVLHRPARPGTAGTCDRNATPLDGDAGTEKYGAASEFARIKKHEDPGFVVDLREALERVEAQQTWRVLYVGCNTGDEITLVRALCPALAPAIHVGIDHSASAIAAARERLSGVELHEIDVSVPGALRALGRFELIVSIGTLQSPGIDSGDLLRTLVQDHLKPHGSVILGIPNCRYVDGEVEYGARMKNFRQPELGLVVKDIAFYRKYLQQHHKQVFVTGKYELLVTAVPTK